MYKNTTKKRDKKTQAKKAPVKKVEEEEEDEYASDEDAALYSDGDSEEFKELEKDAKILRDESVSESGDGEEGVSDELKSEQLDDNEFMTQTHPDLDLPENDSEVASEKDDLDDYYQEVLGIRESRDLMSKKKPKKAQKVNKQEKKRSEVVDKLIETTKTNCSYSNVARVIKIIK